MNDAVGWKWVTSHKGAYFSRLQIREFVYLNTLKCHHHEVVNGPILKWYCHKNHIRSSENDWFFCELQYYKVLSRSKNKQEKGGKLYW